ncbi:MAG: ComEC/Rec2 family competence protein, partial [Halomonadaceae bacterium]
MVLILLGLVSWQLERAVAVFNAPLPDTTVSLVAYPCAPPQWRDGRGLVVTLCPSDGVGWSPQAAPVPRLRGILADQGPDAFPAGPHRFTTQLHPTRVPANPGQWWGEASYLRQGVVAQGTLEDWHPEPGGACSLHCRYHSWRLSLIQRLRQHLPAMAQPGLVEALALGSRAGLDNSHWQTLQATGTNHLVAISGLHLGMVAMMIAWLSHWLLIRTRGQGGPGRAWLIVFLVLAGSGFYALLAGFTVPTRRALVMVSVASVAVAAGRRLRPMDGWLLALVLVLLVDPLAPLDMGFWLSFAAVGCLLLVFANRLRQPAWWWALLVAQLAVMIGLWPMLAVFDRPGTAMALLANIIAIPLMSLVLMPLLLLSLPLVMFSPRSAAWVEPGLSLLLDSLWSGLVWLGERSLDLPELPLGVLLLLAAAMLLSNFPLPMLWRRVTLLLVLCWVLVWPWQPQQSRAAKEGPQLLF